MNVPFIAARTVGGLPLSRAVDLYYRRVHGHLDDVARRYREIKQSSQDPGAVVESLEIVRNDSLGLRSDAVIEWSDCGGGVVELPTIGAYGFSCSTFVAPPPRADAVVEQFETELNDLREHLRSPHSVVIFYSGGSRSIYLGSRDVGMEVLRAGGYRAPERTGQSADPALRSLILHERLLEVRKQSGP